MYILYKHVHCNGKMRGPIRALYIVMHDVHLSGGNMESVQRDVKMNM